MLNCSLTDVYNFEGAIRGMRNPMNSWSKSDSGYCDNVNSDLCASCTAIGGGCFVIGKNDLDLCKRLIKGGTEHRKFLRQVFVSVDVIAPLYWWKEFDTYKIGTSANSTSTMHKIHAKEFVVGDFSCEKMNRLSSCVLTDIINTLNVLRNAYINTKDKEFWYSMVQLLPSSYNQTRTVTLNYEVLLNIYHQRRHHKLDEWHTFCDWIETLPYMKEFLLCLKED